jgi:hypothetical protein
LHVVVKRSSGIRFGGDPVQASEKAWPSRETFILALNDDPSRSAEPIGVK